jgi:hypothetical protein
MSDHVPPNWHTLSLGRLWDRLNDPHQRATPQSTIDAILYCVRQRGLAALDEPENQRRLRECDDAACKQINARIARLFKDHAA